MTEEIPRKVRRYISIAERTSLPVWGEFLMFLFVALFAIPLGTVGRISNLKGDNDD